jgi:catalase
MRPSRIVVAALVAFAPSLSAQAPAKSIPQRIADDFTTLYGLHPGYRINHAKGIVVTGTFTPSAAAPSLSRAAHFKAPVTVVARFSDAGGVPVIPDFNPNSSPRGFAVRFNLPGGAYTDIVSQNHNGFVVGTGEEFAEFLDAVVATKPTSPHPSPSRSSWVRIRARSSSRRLRRRHQRALLISRGMETTR